MYEGPVFSVTGGGPTHVVGGWKYKKTFNELVSSAMANLGGSGWSLASYTNTGETDKGEPQYTLNYTRTVSVTTYWYETVCVKWGTYYNTHTIPGGGLWARRDAAYGAHFSSTAPFQVRPHPSTGLQSKCDNALLQSPHSGGMMAGLGDGSVRFVPASISPTAWSLAVQPDDGKPFNWD